MHEYAEGNELFQRTYFKNHEEELLDLVENGQHPKALFIGCSDSRVIPELMLQIKPGDLFVVRNVGNFVAPYKPDEDYHSTASAIEYAVNVLHVSEIIICGHTHCGAIEALYRDLDAEKCIHTRKWLDLGEKAKSLALLNYHSDEITEELLRITEKFSIITQIDNLLTYPYVSEGVKTGTLHIHGWHYNIENGNIEFYDSEAYKFRPLSELHKILPSDV